MTRVAIAVAGLLIFCASALAQLTTITSSGGGSTLLYDTKGNGLACNDVADDATAFNALLTKVNAAGGGTILVNGMCKIAGQVTLPNSGSATPTQSAIRITGLGGNYYGEFIAPPSASPSGLDLQFNASDAKIQTLGTGLLEIDHLMLKDGSNDCATFIHTTHTTLLIHDNAIQGTASGAAACNDFVVFGGAGIIDNTITSAFQGYGTNVYRNFFDKMRRGAIFNGAANGIVFAENTVSLTAGNGATKAITAATNASAAVLTATGHGFAVGNKVALTISGATGNWAAINGAQTITVIDANTFSVPVNSTAFGALAGAPSFPDGPFLDFVGSVNYSSAGNLITGNLIEMVNYAYFIRQSTSYLNQYRDNNLFDAGAGVTIAYVKVLDAAVLGGTYVTGYHDNGVPSLVGTNAGITLIEGNPSNPTFGIRSIYPSDALLTGINTFAGGNSLFGIRSDSATSLIWSGPASFNGGVQSTSTTTGDIVAAGGVGVGKNLNVAGILTASATQNIFGTQGSSNVITMPQTNGMNATFNADGGNVVFRNQGTGALFFDSFGSGVTNFRSNGGSTTQMVLSLAGLMKLPAYGAGLGTFDGSGNITSVAGVACSGTPSSSFATNANGQVTHC